MPGGQYPRTPEHNAAISRAKMGHATSEETRAKIAATLRGRKPSPEAIEKTRRALTGRKGERQAEVRYRTAHTRVVVDRGLASGFGCVRCGSAPAVEWALDHEFPTESFREQDGRPFSLDVEDYLPMCRPCHSAFDGHAFKAWATKRQH